MEMTGERRIPAPRQQVWDALNDPEALRASIPGCESVERIGDDQFQARVAVKLGPMSAKFGGKVRLENLNPPESYTISGEGSGGAMGFAKGGADVALEEVGPAETLLKYAVKAQVGGKMAQLGARLIDSTAKQMADQFFDRFSARFAQPVAADEVAAAAAQPAGAEPVGAGMATSRTIPPNIPPNIPSGPSAAHPLSTPGSAPEDAANVAGTDLPKTSPANRAATDARVEAARGATGMAGGAGVRNTDTEYLRDAGAPGPISLHGAEGPSASGDPVHRPNPRPAHSDAEALRPLRLLFMMEPFGLPLQFWAGSVIMVVIAALMFL
jgi:hypothetical protein